jgi:ankyrin repeat protein
MLGISAVLGSVELLKLFIDAGVNVNVYARNLDSALCLASSSGNLAAVELLLDAGADVNMLCRLDSESEVEYYQYLNEHGCFNVPSHSEI